MNWIDPEVILETLFLSLIDDHAGLVGLGLFTLAIMVLGSLALAVSMLYHGISVPYNDLKKLWSRDDVS